MLLEDPVQRIQSVPDCTVDPEASNIDTLVASAVTVNPIHKDYKEDWLKHAHLLVSNIYCEQLRFNSALTNVWAEIQWPDGQKQAAVKTALQQNSPKLIHEWPGRLIRRGRQRMRRRMLAWQTTMISRKLVGGKNLVCSATARVKTAPGVLGLWFNYFKAYFFKPLGKHFSIRVRERCGPAFSAFFFVSFLAYGNVSHSLSIFRKQRFDKIMKHFL